MKRPFLLQKMLNTYPMWSRARNNSTSVASQFLTPVADHLEELLNAAREVPSCRFPNMVDMWEASFVYYVLLGSSFTFTEDTSDPHHPRLVPPTIVGDSYTVTVEDDMEHFYNALPTRFELVETTTCTQWNVLDDTTAVSAEIFETLGDINTEGPLVLSVSGCTEFLDSTTGDFAYVTIKGILRKDTEDIYEQSEVEETIHISQNGYYYTKNEWKRVDEVKAVGFTSGTAIKLGDVFGQLYPRKMHYGESYIPYDRREREAMVMLRDRNEDFTHIVQGTAQPPFSYPLVSVVYDVSDDIYDYSPEYDIMYELRTNHITVHDFDVCPFTNYLYILDGSGRCYIYDLRSSTNPLVKEAVLHQSPLAEMHVSRESNSYNGDLQLKLSTAHPLAKHYKFQLTLQYIDGSRYSIDEYGSVTAYDPGVTIPATIKDLSFTPPSYDLGLLKMTNHYTTGRIDYDYEVVGIEEATPIAGPFTFPDVANPRYMYFGADQYLYVGGPTGQIGKYRPAFDVAVVDYDNKTVIMREQYSSVDITA